MQSARHALNTPHCLMLLPENSKAWPKKQATVVTLLIDDDMTHDLHLGEEAWSKVDSDFVAGDLSGNTAAIMTAV